MWGKRKGSVLEQESLQEGENKLIDHMVIFILKIYNFISLKIILKDFDRFDKLEMLGIVTLNNKHVSKKEIIISNNAKNFRRIVQN